jgi:phage portal protein BeeE
VAEFTGNLATNAQPQILLWFPDLDTARLQEIRNYWRNEVEGQGITPIVALKNEPKALQLHPGGDEALYLKYQEFVIREIATAFGLSPQNLGIEHDVNRNTSEVAAERDWDNTVIPLAELLSNHITRQVIHKKLGFYQLEFKFDGLYREDEESLANIFQIYYKNNAMTPNEHRETIGLPPMDSSWGDKTFADFQIAMSAARGTKTIEDPDLSDESESSTSDQLSQQTNQDDQKIDTNEND